ncbi:MAG: T9SS type A sorting domain-containing protein [Bacteroidetes bacterium]|nr:T9SS type A sorting domain-containing protein [Bacteroidota bacterium]
MKTSLLLACTCVLLQTAHAQFNTTTLFSSSGANSGQAVVLDGSGNIYVTGGFHGTVDFAPGSNTVNKTSAGGTDIFIAKYSSAGVLQWADQIGGSGDDEAFSIALDGNGYVTVGGSFSGTVDFDPSSSTSNRTSNGAQDIWFGKYSMSTGALSWATSFGSSNTDDRVNALTCDGSGNVYIGGYIGTGTTDVDPGSGTYNVTNNSSYGAGNIFFGKYSSSGAFGWANEFPGCCDWVNALTLDGSGNLCVSGLFQGGPVDFDPSSSTVNLYAYYYGDIWFGKYSTSNGSYQWVKKLDGYNQSDAPFAMVVDASGNIIIAGEQGGPGNEDFDPGSGTSNLYGNGIYNSFVAKYSSSGAYVWAVNAGASNTYNMIFGLGIASNGDIHAVGYLQGSVDYDPSSSTHSLTATGNTDALDWVLSSSGSYVGAYHIGSSPYSSEANAVAMNGNTPIITGFYATSSSTAIDLFIANMGSTPLPINLASFAVTQVGQINRLTWEAAGNGKPLGFYIERSEDGERFATIGMIEPTSSNRYHYDDVIALSETEYYRLRIPDNNGSIYSSQIIKVSHSIPHAVQIYPNPTSTKKIHVVATVDCRYKLFGIDGRDYQEMNLSVGNNTIELPGPGVFLLKVYSNQGIIQTERIVSF